MFLNNSPNVKLFQDTDIIKLSMSALSGYIDRIGKQELYRDLDVDRDRGNYIRSNILKFIYQTLFSAAQYIVAFLLLFITLTQQLSSVNVFQFIEKSQHIYLFGTILSICLLIHLIRQFHTKVAQNPKEKKWSSLAIDILKIVVCYLSYYFINEQYVVPSHTSNIKYSGCILFILFIFFAARKIFFWILFTVGSESENVEPWNPHAIETKSDEELTSIENKINALALSIKSAKGKANQGAKADDKSKES